MGDERGGGGDLPREVEEGQLGGQPGREEAETDEEDRPAHGSERVEREGEPDDRGDEKPAGGIHAFILPAEDGRLRP